MPDSTTADERHRRVLLQLPRPEVPLALAELHRSLLPGARIEIDVICHSPGLNQDGPRAKRPIAPWDPGELEELCHGAGFTVERARHDEPGRDPSGPDHTTAPWLRLRREATLPDTVGPGMRLLICGLNPSPYAAEVGIAFARPGNRFWPAARAAGLVTADRDPFRAVCVDRVGMTDLVKRVTRRADELTTYEYQEGLARLDRLVGWLRPGAVCFVGLAGWRAGVGRKARAGVQTDKVGGRPVYLMPSTSGLNAHSTPADLAEHLRAAARLADQADPAMWSRK